MSKLSSHVCWQIIERSLEGLSQRQISRRLGISKTTVQRIHYRFKKYGCIENISFRGRPRIFGCDDMKYLETLLKEK